MQVEQLIWRAHEGWSAQSTAIVDTAHWILAFGAPAALLDDTARTSLRTRYPGARIVGCSTAGEICGTKVHDDTIVATAVRFDHTRIRVSQATVANAQEDSYRAGVALATELIQEGLTHVMVLSDGLNVNGTQLSCGLHDRLPPEVVVTGGLAGDADRFQRTLVWVDDTVSENRAVAIGFYGDRLRIGFGSLGGWDSFGPARLVTRAQDNVLYELDGQPALELYKRYLGEHAANLPSSALMFPLAVHAQGNEEGLVRTILAIDEEQGSLTFAGDIPQGAYARLMKANVDRLVDGAAGAARSGLQALDTFAPELAVLISCVGRKLVLKQRVEEEVDSVRDVLGPQAALAGFYSYGEICPQGEVKKCELHNQTMTVTTFSEK